MATRVGVGFRLSPLNSAQTLPHPHLLPNHQQPHPRPLLAQQQKIQLCLPARRLNVFQATRFPLVSVRQEAYYQVWRVELTVPPDLLAQGSKKYEHLLRADAVQQRTYITIWPVRAKAFT